ncbi:hypothetical protein NKI56_32400 [Mesorhizobium sp. M0622]|uniref:hypothetical protein n=1 Tax=unclassified Mesorhizobium TaxID=325217 RepID=UPI00333A46E7
MKNIILGQQGVSSEAPRPANTSLKSTCPSRQGRANSANLIAGLGWEHMPLPIVADELVAEQLVQILLEGPRRGLLSMQAIYKADSLPGRAARWLLDRIRSPANMRLREWAGLRA